MSRCKACDVILEENELLRKYPNGEFMDLCNTCNTNSGLYDGAVYDSKGDLVSYSAIPESEFRFEYAGGVGSEDYVDFWLDYENERGGRKDYIE